MPLLILAMATLATPRSTASSTVLAAPDHHASSVWIVISSSSVDIAPFDAESGVACLLKHPALTLVCTMWCLPAARNVVDLKTASNDPEPENSLMRNSEAIGSCHHTSNVMGRAVSKTSPWYAASRLVAVDATRADSTCFFLVGSLEEPPSALCLSQRAPPPTGPPTPNWFAQLLTASRRG